MCVHEHIILDVCELKQSSAGCQYITGVGGTIMFLPALTVNNSTTLYRLAVNRSTKFPGRSTTFVCSTVHAGLTYKHEDLPIISFV